MVLKPYTPRFDGSDTSSAVQKFLENGGSVQKCPTHKPATGNIRYNMNITRKKERD